MFRRLQPAVYKDDYSFNEFGKRKRGFVFNKEEGEEEDFSSFVFDKPETEAPKPYVDLVTHLPGFKEARLKDVPDNVKDQYKFKRFVNEVKKAEMRTIMALNTKKKQQSRKLDQQIEHKSKTFNFPF